MSVLRTSLRNFFAHKGRMILSGLAVLISVAFVCGTLVFTATMQTTFNKLFEDSASDVMVTTGSAADDWEAPNMTGRPDTMPASVVDDIDAVDGVERTIGVVESESLVVVDSEGEDLGPGMGAPTVAVNWTELEDDHAEVSEGSQPGAAEILVDDMTAENSDVSVGDQVTVETVTGRFDMTVSGVFEFLSTNPGAAIVYMDTATAQEVLLGADAYTMLQVESDGSVSDEVLRDRVAEVLTAHEVTVQTGDEYVEDNQDAIAEAFSIIQWVLLGFALIALVVGIFLILNTFTMLVAQRTREIGLFRAIGASRKQINRSVRIEALILGVVGSVLGIGAGILLAIGLMQLMNAVGMNLSTDDLTINASVPIIGLVIGIGVTLLAAYFPARRAARISPMAALQDVGMPGDQRAGRRRAIIGGGMTALGLAALVVPALTDSMAVAGQFLLLGVLVSLVGLVLFAPFLVRGVIRVFSAVLLRGFGSIGRMAERNAMRNTRRTGATASALMIGLALVSALAVVGSSMVSSASKQIDESIGADFIVQTSNFMPIMPEGAEAISGADHVATTVEQRIVTGEATAGDDAPFEFHVNVVDPGLPDVMDAPVDEGDLDEVLENGEIAIGSAQAEREGIELGDTISVTLADEYTAELTVGALTTPFADSGSMAYVSTETAREVIDESDFPLPMLMMALAEEGMQDEARASLDAVTEGFPTLEIRDQTEFKEMLEEQIGQMLNMVYGLLALAIIVAVLGVVNTLALSVVERTREIGLMRAIGLSRRQLRRMIRLESVVIALFGATLGVAIGLAWGVSMFQLLAMEGMEVMTIPWGTIVTVFVGAAVVGLLAALMPAFRAGRMNVLNAIATE